MSDTNQLLSSGRSRLLTLDNTHLSRLKMGAVARSVTEENISDEAIKFVQASISDNTQRAYNSDLAHIIAWGGGLPVDPETVASYLAAHAETLSVATLVRRVATISKALETARLPNACRSEVVRATLKGIRRLRGTAQRQAKPLLRDDLLLVLDAMGGDPKSTRDRAILLLGFAGGFRRSELVSFDCGDVERVGQGLILTLRGSKTDQERAGRQIGIPYGRTRHCPVAALAAWLTLAGNETGPIFRPVDRCGHVRPERLSGEAVCLVLRERLMAAGIDSAGYSGHSLRAGFATSAAQAGVSSVKIRAQTGHASDTMLTRYIRAGELFIGNAAGALI